MKQLNLYYLGGGGGGGTVPNGATVTPTDDIQIWLHCADIWDKDYTNLAEVLADTDTLSVLIASSNAVDYMVRSTTWVASITDSNKAMLLIGANNYAANTLLGDSTWLAAICDSDYFEYILNYKVPEMTSNTTPSGVVSSSSVYGTGYEAFRAFDNNLGSLWCSVDSDKRGWIQYMFPKAVHIYMVYNRLSTTPLSRQFKVFDLTASNDGNTWENLGRYDNSGVTGASIKAAITNNGVYKYYRCTGVQNVDSLDLCGCCELNFYGREDV